MTGPVRHMSSYPSEKSVMIILERGFWRFLFDESEGLPNGHAFRGIAGEPSLDLLPVLAKGVASSEAPTPQVSGT